MGRTRMSGEPARGKPNGKKVPPTFLYPKRCVDSGREDLPGFYGATRSRVGESRKRRGFPGRELSGARSSSVNGERAETGSSLWTWRRSRTFYRRSWRTSQIITRLRTGGGGPPRLRRSPRAVNYWLSRTSCSARSEHSSSASSASVLRCAALLQPVADAHDRTRDIVFVFVK